MISEYVLLLMLSVLMFTGALGSIKTTFQNGVPRLAVRVEKYLMTGHMFSLKVGTESDGTVEWGN